jgi:hypothetical protein
MSVIIAARFTTFPKAEEAAHKLFEQGFVEEDVTLFYVSPSGQHSRLATGGDHHSNAGAKDSPKGAGTGVTIGAVVGAIIGAAIFAVFKAPWFVSIIAAGIGAYIGSLAGAMSLSKSGKSSVTHSASSTDNHGSANAIDARQSGVLVAVHASPETQEVAANTLRAAGGMEVERASGQWRNGRWADFDATKPPKPVEELASQRV